MNKITTIGITSPCGGNGCTTLAVHLAWQASQIRGIRTLAVSMDRTGALVRQFFPDGGLRVDSVAHILPNLDVCYFAVEGAVSELLPTLGLKADEYPSLIVVDLGSGMSSDLLEDVDLWLTPVADLRTMRALLDTGYPRSGKAKTYIAFNRAERNNQYARRLLAEAGDRCSDLSILHSEIPHSGAIQRANHRHETVWQHSRESRAAAVLKSWADEVLDLAMPKWQADEARPLKVPGAGLLADELLRMDQHRIEEQARKLDGTLRKLNERLCPVCKKTPLSGRQQICSTKCRSTSYRARLRGSAVPIPGISRLRVESDRHTRPTDERSLFEGYPAPTTQVALSPQVMESLLPIVAEEGVEPPLPIVAEAHELAEEEYPTPVAQEYFSSRQVVPILVEQEVVLPISEVLPTEALSLRSTPKPGTESLAQKAWDSIPNVAPRKSRPLSNIEALQERIDAANADLISASQNPTRATRRKPLST